MAKDTVATLQARTVPAGPGEIISAVIPADAETFVASFQQVGWPHEGDKAFDFACEIAVDGSNFIELMTGDLTDLPVPSRNGSAPNSFNISVGPLPGVGLIGRKLRFSWVFAKPLTVSASLRAIVGRLVA